MALSTAIYTLLHNNATIEAVVGDRIYPGVAPFNASLPCIVYQIGNIDPSPTMDDDLVWDSVTVEVAVITTQYTLSETYATNVRTALSRQYGTVDGEVINTIKFDGMTAEYLPDFTIGDSPVGGGVFIRTVNFTLIRTG
jgi:hypothetical protein